MTIYADVIWLLNLGIDTLLLMLTAFFLKRDPSRWRLCLGALFASSYVWFILFPVGAMMLHPLMKVLFSAVIVLIVFGFYGFRRFIQAWFMFYFVNFAVAGGLFAVHFLLSNETHVVNGVMTTQMTGFGSPVSWLFLFVGFPLLAWFTKARMEDTQMNKVNYEQLVQVEIMIGQERWEYKGFIDSGNSCKDPMTNRPVMMIDMMRVADSFPKDVVHFARSVQEMEEVSHGEVPPFWLRRMRLVPFRTIGDTHSMMAAFKPDLVVIKNDGEIRETSNVLIGFVFTDLSATGEYQCLLHPKMMQNARISTIDTERKQEGFT
ncbi:sigma-E processing peptidase SpoIIGA [Texcoconibacillus texcoconensis]|uniref:Stage II sporulation protein GA (Sporulation sigma-E factor processing peptidase) n=1 Tax=Texcoconibacillus texcoconensis TaxID=1095777 RepID=A0A840QLB7_9BACI|nr:sigma-E processing peptidase SpoIIGA [Texcoconibacillus texcoconensis]MBB5172164.1 stage II sporulation protein GA (sporulation sigma-E factor processing peptidase) [Texcoconibacillus texcoconensis]